MPTITVTNQKASQALRGEDVLVTLSPAEQSNLDSILPGQSCSISGVPVYGIISFVDNYGSSFEITPLLPSLNFSTPSTPGYLAENETIIITT